MTVRSYVAMIYGITALGIAVFTHMLAGTAGADEPVAAGIVDRAPIVEIEPGLTGHAEIDDLPAYLSGPVHDHG